MSSKLQETVESGLAGKQGDMSKPDLEAIKLQVGELIKNIHTSECNGPEDCTLVRAFRKCVALSVLGPKADLAAADRGKGGLLTRLKTVLARSADTQSVEESLVNDLRIINETREQLCELFSLDRRAQCLVPSAIDEALNMWVEEEESVVISLERLVEAAGTLIVETMEILFGEEND